MRAYLTCYNTAVSRVVVIITVSTFQKHFIIRPRKALLFLLVVSVEAITIPLYTCRRFNQTNNRTTYTNYYYSIFFRFVFKLNHYRIDCVRKSIRYIAITYKILNSYLKVAITSKLLVKSNIDISFNNTCVRKLSVEQHYNKFTYPVLGLL